MESTSSSSTISISTRRRAGRQAKKLNLALAFDAKDFDVEVLTAQSRAEGFSISPSGDYMAVDYHGEIMIVPTDAGVGERTQVTSSPWRDRAESYSPDGRKVAYVSDEGGEQQVWLYDIATSSRKKLTNVAGDKDNIVWASNSQKLAYSSDNKIVEIDARRRAARNHAQPRRRLHRSTVLGRWQLAGLQPSRRRAECRGVSLRHSREEGVQRHAVAVERDVGADLRRWEDRGVRVES
jgi:hypothetical protein